MPSDLTDSDKDGTTASTSEPKPVKPILDVVGCGVADASPIVVAAHSVRADVRLASSPESLLEQLNWRSREATLEPADVVVFVGVAESLISQQWIARASQLAPELTIAAALIDGSIDQAAYVVNQGARGLLTLPNSLARLSRDLREISDAALRFRASRRNVMKHRRAASALTPAEHEVLEGMLAGMPNKQIAQRLSIGLRTVELRRSKIMKKMKAKSLAQLISYICAAQGHSG
ncbi:Transcriptional regulatory protein FixJ [Botrimarina colliarenosi]|uniref:Transcriptional regulatory protein FixJ n=1 Tax=Botrimarina colliarenosi TaxID=2528001 RepID=A0A5C6A9N1_9BACT|nr:Transcriptional regulatory protein FixJ [Botrimarina colliarenosi]